MKKIALFCLFILAIYSQNIQAQSAYGIPLDSVKIFVDAHPDVFQELGLRFIAGDTTLDFGDYHLLYYGSAYTGSYSPYGEGTFCEAVRELREQEKYDEAIQTARDVLTQNPALVSMYRELGNTYSAKKDSINASFFYDRYITLLKVPYFSGSGESYDSAMVVRSVDDEYSIIYELNFRPGGQALQFHNKMPFDVMTVTEEDENGKTTEHTLYFNVYQSYMLGLGGMFGKSEEPEKEKGKKKKKKKGKKE